GGGDVGEHPILPPGMALRASHFSPVRDRSDDREDGHHPFACRMSSWERKHHEPGLAKNCSLWTVSRLIIRASVLQRSPSSRLRCRDVACPLGVLCLHPA